MTRYVMQVFFLFCACAFAWRRGGGPERFSAVTMALMFAIDPLYHVLWGNFTVYKYLNIGHFAIDSAAMVALLTIALKANRRWTIVMASVQILAVLSHFLRFIMPEMNPFVYAVFSRVPSYLQIVLLFLGAERHRRRVRRIGNYPSWQTS